VAGDRAPSHSVKMTKPKFLRTDDGFMKATYQKRKHDRRITSNGSGYDGSSSSSEIDSDPEYETHEMRHRKTVLATQYLIIMEPSRKDTRLTTLRSLTFARELKRAVGFVKSVKPLRSGAFLIECQSKEQAEQLLSLTNICETDIQCKYPKSLVESKGVISGIHTDETMEDILGDLEGQSVKEVRRLNRGKEKIPTKSLVLTFDTPHLPTKVTIGYQAYSVRAYIPATIRCNKCQRFNHIESECRSKVRCVHCGLEHPPDECSQSEKPTCVNCGGEHSASDSTCPSYKLACDIKKVKVEKRVTYAEAAHIVRSSTKGPLSTKPIPRALISQPLVNTTTADESEIQHKPGKTKPKHFRAKRMLLTTTKEATVKQTEMKSRDTQTESHEVETQTDSTILSLDSETLVMFLAFMAEALSNSLPLGKKSDKIKAVVDAANKVFPIAITGEAIFSLIKWKEEQ
jgi:hypothetical protein